MQAYAPSPSVTTASQYSPDQIHANQPQRSEGKWVWIACGVGLIGVALVVLGGLAVLNERTDWIANKLATRITAGVALALGTVLIIVACRIYVKTSQRTPSVVKLDQPATSPSEKKPLIDKPASGFGTVPVTTSETPSHASTLLSKLSESIQPAMDCLRRLDDYDSQLELLIAQVKLDPSKNRTMVDGYLKQRIQLLSDFNRCWEELANFKIKILMEEAKKAHSPSDKERVSSFESTHAAFLARIHKEPTLQDSFTAKCATLQSTLMDQDRALVAAQGQHVVDLERQRRVLSGSVSALVMKSIPLGDTYFNGIKPYFEIFERLLLELNFKNPASSSLLPLFQDVFNAFEAKLNSKRLTLENIQFLSQSLNTQKDLKDKLEFQKATLANVG